jgi:hypothetical protein
MADPKPGYTVPLPAFTLMRADTTGPVRLVKPDSGEPFLLLFTTVEKAEAFRERVGWPSFPLVELRTPEEITDFVIEQINFTEERRAEWVAIDPELSPDGTMGFDGLTVEQLALNFPVFKGRKP